MNYAAFEIINPTDEQFKVLCKTVIQPMTIDDFVFVPHIDKVIDSYIPKVCRSIKNDPVYKFEIGSKENIKVAVEIVKKLRRDAHLCAEGSKVPTSVNKWNTLN